MLLSPYKNILPASIAIIGGMIIAFGQPEQVMANNRLGYSPSPRPEPQGTQGGGSRLSEKAETVFLQLLAPDTNSSNRIIR